MAFQDPFRRALTQRTPPQRRTLGSGTRQPDQQLTLSQPPSQPPQQQPIQQQPQTGIQRQATSRTGQPLTASMTTAGGPLPGQAPLPNPGQQPAAHNPWAQYGIDPLKPVQAGMSGTLDQAVQGLQYAGQSILGRALTQEDLNKAAAAAGYSGSGPVSGEQYNKALAYLQGLKGQQPGQPGAGAPAAPAGGFGSGWGNAQAPVAAPQTQFDQFQAPDFSQFEGGVDAIMQRILANPQTLGSDAVNAMKMRAKEQGLEQAKQLRQQSAEALAGRGFSGAGGTQAAADAQVDDALLTTLINSNREIDLEALERNRRDELQAMGAAEEMMTGRAGRAGDMFRNRLLGQTTQDEADFRNANFRYGQMRDDRNFGLQEFLGRHGVDMDNKKLLEQIRQFDKVSALDLAKFLEGRRQFDSSFGEDQRQFNNTLARGYSQDNAQSQDRYLNYLRDLYGGF